jgi:hypothetical protein
LIEESGAETAVNERLARALYRWRLKDPSGSRSGRVVVHYEARPAGGAEKSTGI